MRVKNVKKKTLAGHFWNEKGLGMNHLRLHYSLWVYQLKTYIFARSRFMNHTYLSDFSIFFSMLFYCDLFGVYCKICLWLEILPIVYETERFSALVTWKFERV